MSMSKQDGTVKPKQKPISKSKSAKNAHLHARAEYLQRAARYLGVNKADNTGHEQLSAETLLSQNWPPVAETQPKQAHGGQQAGESRIKQTGMHGSQRYLVNHARSVALKSQIRLSQEAKRRICKKCDTPLVSGETCSTQIENLSKNGKKPWADVLVMRCLVCDCQKRFPVGATRQKKKRTSNSCTSGDPQDAEDTSVVEAME